MKAVANGLVVAGNFKREPVGLAEHTHRMALHLAGLGERIAVLASAMPGAEEFDAGCGYPVVRCPLPERGRLPGARRIEGAFRRVQTAPPMPGAVVFEAFGGDVPNRPRKIGILQATSDAESFHVASLEATTLRSASVYEQDLGNRAFERAVGYFELEALPPTDQSIRALRREQRGGYYGPARGVRRQRGIVGPASRHTALLRRVV